MRDLSVGLPLEFFEALRDLDFRLLLFDFEVVFFFLCLGDFDLDLDFDLGLDLDLDFDFELDLSFDCFILDGAGFLLEDGLDLDLDLSFGSGCFLAFVVLILDLDRGFFEVCLAVFIWLDLLLDLLLLLLLELFFFLAESFLEVEGLFFLLESGLLSFLRLSCMPLASTSEEEARGDISPPLRSNLGVRGVSSPTKVQSSSTR